MWVISVRIVLVQIKMLFLVHHWWVNLSMIISKTNSVCPLIKLMLEHYSLLHVWRITSWQVMILWILLFKALNWAIVTLEWTLKHITLIYIINLNRFQLLIILLFWLLNTCSHWHWTLWFLWWANHWNWGLSTLIHCLHRFLRHHLLAFDLLIALLDWGSINLLRLTCNCIFLIIHWWLWWLKILVSLWRYWNMLIRISTSESMFNPGSLLNSWLNWWPWPRAWKTGSRCYVGPCLIKYALLFCWRLALIYRFIFNIWFFQFILPCRDQFLLKTRHLINLIEQYLFFFFHYLPQVLLTKVIDLKVNRSFIWHAHFINHRCCVGDERFVWFTVRGWFVWGDVLGISSSSEWWASRVFVWSSLTIYLI